MVQMKGKMNWNVFL